ncbi:hypothetical protein PUNSTDRAFT_120343 [Punctularia strigosozonata HHB-11173 SS5]|uniref:uncharacterized protein n=1 Tax=Punctularia strigosozonata (strain HHB-11173) TaxID=741275 RepID=UPI0004416D31|nr:uncharacterized protein PUNSTDRAFT_120343 [Punctularia strigosozonata HHB-11173 SS5]EIN08752.1 hypothetical protein PUNSTDRAFT_120343 [Punctularia strigosozonata HHB-11173 SS5]
MSSRPLLLHTSALNDAEYDLYTACFRDLVDADDDEHRTQCDDDQHLDRTTVGVREVRAWLRGRYPDVATQDVDSILRLFCPNLGPTDILNGGQFFAVLRLLTHVRHGEALDRSLVFRQAHPEPSSRVSSPFKPPPPRRSTTLPPSRPSRLIPTNDLPTPDTSPSTTHTTHNPFERPTPDLPPRPKPAVHQRTDSTHRRAVSASIPSVPATIGLAGSSSMHSNNPFRNKPPKPPAPSASTKPTLLPAGHAANGISPPLPPRKPPPPPVPIQPPPRHQSMLTPIPSSPATPLASAGAGASMLVEHTKPILSAHSPRDISPATTGYRSTPSPLIKNSLHASKVAQSIRKAEEQLENQRVLHVLKRSTSASGSTSQLDRQLTGSSATSSSGVGATSSIVRNRSASPTKGPVLPTVLEGRAQRQSLPPLPKRKYSSPPPASAASARSMESLANAHFDSSPFLDGGAGRDEGNRSSPSPTRSPSRPPQHPGRKSSMASSDVSGGGTTTPPRVGRSKSLHHPSGPPPVPPPRRKRPESVQVTASSSSSGGDPLGSPFRTAPAYPSTATFGSLSRHLSLTSRPRRSLSGERLSEDSPVSSIQRAFVNLGAKAQPKFEAAMYKAEAGLSRRGYVPHHHRRDDFSMARGDRGEERLFEGNGEGEEVAVDEDDSSDEEETRRRLHLDSGKGLGIQGDDDRGRRWNEGYKPL